MALGDGEAAEAWDFWLRTVTNKKHLYGSKKRVHHSALGGAGGLAPHAGRGWTHELSGRLNSFARSACADAEAYCKARGLTYIGIIYAQVGVLRDNKFGHDTDVRYTPIPHQDDGHADFVIFGAPDDFVLDSIKDWLRDNVLRPLHAQEAPAVIGALPRTNPYS
jgi:hypothetical protein